MDVAGWGVGMMLPSLRKVVERGPGHATKGPVGEWQPGEEHLCSETAWDEAGDSLERLIEDMRMGRWMFGDDKQWLLCCSVNSVETHKPNLGHAYSPAQPTHCRYLGILST